MVSLGSLREGQMFLAHIKAGTSGHVHQKASFLGFASGGKFFLTHMSIAQSGNKTGRRQQFFGLSSPLKIPLQDIHITHLVESTRE